MINMLGRDGIDMNKMQRFIEGIKKALEWASYGWVNYSASGDIFIQPYIYTGIEVNRH